MRAFVLIGLFVLSVLLRQALAKNWRAGRFLLAATVPALLAPWFFPSASRADLSPVGLLRSLTAREHFSGTPHGEPDLEGPRSGSAMKNVKSSVNARSTSTPGKASTSRPTISSGERNRPSPASFATYTPELDRMNARFLSSAERPRYLLWHLQPGVQSIDGRHLFWDEPVTLRTIVGSSGTVVRGSAYLLEELGHRRLSEPRIVQVVETKWDTWVPVSAVDGVILAAAQLERPWRKALRKALFREDRMFLSVRFEDGDEKACRFVRSGGERILDEPAAPGCRRAQANPARGLQPAPR